MWDPKSDKDEWTHNNFIHCILEGLRRAKIKPLNYSQVTAVQQVPLETPVAFLQRLKDALQKDALQHCTGVTGGGDHPKR
jgi:hypothetical protein